VLSTLDAVAGTHYDSPMTRNRLLVMVAATAIGLALAVVACGGSPRRPDGGHGLLTVGAAAPDLRGEDQTGTVQRLSSERGHPVVVYFYPKDGTPGCTREACAFRDAWARFEAAGVRVWGVSADSRESHARFAREQNLTFPLLADPELRWASAFGVGTTMGMTHRVTFLVDPAGRIAKVYPEVDPAVHADEVLADAAALTGTAP
jgi:thioredoxin-dependent peroxiredoxin